MPVSWDGKRLKEAMEIKGRTAKWMARKCGVSEGTMKNYGFKQKPPRPTRILICIRLGLPEDYFEIPQAKVEAA